MMTNQSTIIYKCKIKVIPRLTKQPILKFIIGLVLFQYHMRHTKLHNKQNRLIKPEQIPIRQK